MGTHGHNVLVIAASVCKLGSYHTQVRSCDGILDVNFEKSWKGQSDPSFIFATLCILFVEFSGFCICVTKCRFLALFFSLKMLSSKRASIIEVTGREMAGLCFFCGKSYLKLNYWNWQEILLRLIYPGWQHLFTSMSVFPNSQEQNEN